MLKLSGREREGKLRIEDIEQFPGEGNYDEKIWNSFGDRVEWQVNNVWLSYSKLSFTLNAPLGHLPRWCGVAAWRRFVFVCLGLFSRIEICSFYQNF